MELTKKNEILTKVETSFGWKRNLNYLKAQFILMLKSLVEYKANFYSTLSIEFIYFGIIFVFFTIMTSNFSEIIVWSKSDLILYTLFTSLIGGFSGLISWKENLFSLATKGTLNSFLTKPINTWFFYLGFEMSPPAIIVILIDIIFIGILKFYFQLEFFNIFLSFIIFILLIILYIAVFSFLLSLDLIKLGLSNAILVPYNRTFFFFESYPILFFKQAPFKLLLLFIFPIAFIGSLLIPLLRGYEFMFNPFLQVGIILFLIIVFSIGSWLNWHYGLKKYEGFG